MARQSDAAANGMLDTLNARIGASGKLQGWTVPRPATIADPETGTKLFELPLGNPAFAAAGGRQVVANAITSAAALATGTVEHLRVIDGSGNAVLDVPTSEFSPPAGSSGAVTAGTNVSSTGFTISLLQGA